MCSKPPKRVLTKIHRGWRGERNYLDTSIVWRALVDQPVHESGAAVRSCDEGRCEWSRAMRTRGAANDAVKAVAREQCVEQCVAIYTAAHEGTTCA